VPGGTEAVKKIILAVLVLGVGGSLLWYFTSHGAQEQSYRFVTVERGDLESTVSSTGSLEAVTTVEVGTQVSGIISETFVDFNDYVTKGQVIARLDTTLLAISAHEAEANRERSQADLKNSEREFERVRGLYEKGHVSDADFNAAEFALDVARAGLKASNLNVERARQNLAYATVYAPISGTVIERDVDVGQTVAASLSAPRLFSIAADLSQMQILASVDESDIGMIESGQQARFTVQAYPEEMFQGTVRQVRLHSKSQENVVTYTVVIDVANKDRRLLPGMTATIDFVIETASDVLMISNAALRFRPTTAMMAEVRERRSQMLGNRGDSNVVRSKRDMSSSRRDGALLWHLDELGTLAADRVRTGISDGQSTAITGTAIEEGTQVIAGISTGTQNSSSNPFSAPQQSEPRSPRGPGF
jgi:HlyD family secretion protein